MRIAITGEKGFIAKNLSKLINDSDHEFVSLDHHYYHSPYHLAVDVHSLQTNLP